MTGSTSVSRVHVAGVSVAGVPVAMANTSRVRRIAMPVAMSVATVRQSPDSHHAEADRTGRERDEIKIHA